MTNPIGPEDNKNPWSTYWSAKDFVHAVEVRDLPFTYNVFKALSYLHSEGWSNAVLVQGAQSIFHPNADYYFYGDFVFFRDQSYAAMLKMHLD